MTILFNNAGKDSEAGAIVPLLWNSGDDDDHFDDNLLPESRAVKGVNCDRHAAASKDQTSVQEEPLESDCLSQDFCFREKLDRCYTNWISALLLSTVLLFIAWMTVRELTDRQRKSSRIAGVTDDCWSVDLKDNAFIHHTIPSRNRSSKVQVLLSSFNDAKQNSSRSSFISIKHCPDDMLVRLTVARLQMRFDRRAQTRALASMQNAQLAIAHENLDFFGTGLGNFMFITAALRGIAKSNNRSFVFLTQHKHEKAFLDLKTEHREFGQLFGDNITADQLEALTYKEQHWGMYDVKSSNLSAHFGRKNLQSSGYFQSYKYFDQFRTEIRNMFVMKNVVTETALKVIETHLQQFTETKFGRLLEKLPRLVGVHVRRGDIVSGVHHDYGHQPASDEYLLRTVLHVQTQHEPVAFLVLSNDIGYCKSLFPEENFLFMDNHDSAEVDMAILSVMDYLILSVGTFGWWGAYLSDAREVYYYRDWPRNGSAMQQGIDAHDYFPAAWIPGV